MQAIEVIFWLCAAIALYTYAGYAIVLAVAARLKRGSPQREKGYAPSVSFVLCAHNEKERIGDRIAEITAMLAGTVTQHELIVVSDGSTDATAARASECANATIKVIELAERQGKAAALSAGCSMARNEILVFGDCRQQWRPDALSFLLENFADPTVGAVSGDLVLQASPGVMSGVGLYWRHEKWLRRNESRVYSTVGVTGAISAVRRTLFPGVPAGTILDDVYWPMVVTMLGHRVLHDQRAVALDRLPDRPRDEFRRKVRTLAGNFQLVTNLPQLLLPWKNPVWLQFVSHKLLRLAVPWLLLVMLAAGAVLTGPLYRTLFLCQLGFYALALAGNIRGVASQLRPAAAAASLLVLNAAAWLAFWVWVTGRTGSTWQKVRYREAA